MKRFSYFIFSILFFLFSFEKGDGQIQTDSLQNALNNCTTDTCKILALYSLGSEYLANDSVESALHYTNSALSKSQQINYWHGVVICNNQIGKILIDKGEIKSSIAFFKNALKIAQSNNDTIELLTANDNLAVAYNHLGNYDTSIFLRQNNLPIYISQKNYTKIADAYIWIGNSKMSQAKYEDALANFINSLKNANLAKDKRRIAFATLSCARVYVHQKNYNKAKELNFQGLEALMQIDDRRNMGTVYYNIGNIFNEENNNDSALVYYLKSLKIAQELKSDLSIAKSLNSIGAAYYGKQDLLKAKDYFFKSLVMIRVIGDKESEAMTLVNLGSIYFDNGNNDSSAIYFNNGLAIAKAINQGETIKSCYSYLSKLYERKKDYANALKYFKLFKEINDTIYQNISSEKVLELQTAYETEKKEKEIIVLNNDKKVKEKEIIAKTLEANYQRTLKYIGFFSIGIVLISSFYIFRKYKSEEKTKNANALLQQQLRIRDNIHDEIGASSTAISRKLDLCDLNNPEEVKTTFSKVKIESDALTASFQTLVWSLKPENEHLRALIPKIRTYAAKYLADAKINLLFDFPMIDTDLKLKPNLNIELMLITKEALNNIVKYSRCTEVNLSMTISKNIFKYTISDNGIGFNPDVVSIDSNGLSTMKKRSEDMQCQINIISEIGKGTAISISGSFV